MKKLKILMAFCISAGIVSLFTGVTFTAFNADLKGTNVNKVSTSKITFIYDELKNNTAATMMTDSYGMENSDYIEFSTKAISSGAAKVLYSIYLSEHEGNTLTSDKIKIYLTDQDDVPASDDFKDFENGRGKLCYDYENNQYYELGTEEYKNCTPDDLELNESKYIFNSKYITKVSQVSSTVCKKYTNLNGEIVVEDADVSNCRYGDVYKPKANLVTFKNAENNSNLTNVIFSGDYTFDGSNETKEQERIYRLRCWSTETEAPLTETTTEEGTHTSESTELIYNFGINIYSKQVALGE